MSLADAEGWGVVYQENADAQARRNADASPGPGWYDWLADQWNNVRGTVGTGQAPNLLTAGSGGKIPPGVIAVAAGVGIFLILRSASR